MSDIKLACQFWGRGWGEQLAPFLENAHFQNLIHRAKQVHRKGLLCPDIQFLFRAFQLTSWDTVRVVVVGQDPYHTPGIADGLAFSSREPEYKPPSLRNIFKELSRDLSCPTPSKTDLTPWAQQGVLLLNRYLTTEKHKAKAHRHWGWQHFTTEVIRRLSQTQDKIVYILWGKTAQEVEPHINYPHWNLVLKSAHPSPFSCKNFFGNQHFAKTNQYLQQQGEEPIDWCSL